MKRRRYVQTAGGIVTLGIAGVGSAAAAPGTLTNATVTASGAIVATGDNFVIAGQDLTVDGTRGSPVIHNDGYSGEIYTFDRFGGRRRFGLDDVAQQIVGGFILSAPFVVTEEVWSLTTGMSGLQWAITLFMVIAIGYGTLYRADDEREAEREESVAGLPLRFISLMLISYLSVAILAFVFNAPSTFEADTSATLKAISIGAIFSVVGAATADSLF